MTLGLFSEEADQESANAPRPLADRMRPVSLDEFVGQEDLLGKDKPLRILIETGEIPSMILCGPPGSGKTTLARLMAKEKGFAFKEISAVSAGVSDIRSAIDFAQNKWKQSASKTILFIDEIHRFSKVQQDAILPKVEDGTLVMIGSTTEHHGISVTASLRSRCRVFQLEPLLYDDILALVKRALTDKERGLGNHKFEIKEGVLEKIVELSGGDARAALNLLESSAYAASRKNQTKLIGLKLVKELSRDASIHYDKLGKEHYDHASALQKSMRGSDPDAAIYWLAKMLKGGEDPMFIARRLIVTASEDVGLADPASLLVAIAAAEAVERLGMPECRIPLAHAVIHIATAPKSNSAVTAIDKALEDIGQGKSFQVPNHLKDNHYRPVNEPELDDKYKYPHDYKNHWVKQDYLPSVLKFSKYYNPSDQGRENAISERLKRKK